MGVCVRDMRLWMSERGGVRDGKEGERVRQGKDVSVLLGYTSEDQTVNKNYHHQRIRFDSYHYYRQAKSNSTLGRHQLVPGLSFICSFGLATQVFVLGCLLSSSLSSSPSA